MGLARHVGAAQAAEEVEIGSAVRLENMVDVELGLPPACVGLRSFPFSIVSLVLSSNRHQTDTKNFFDHFSWCRIRHQSIGPLGTFELACNP